MNYLFLAAFVLVLIYFFSLNYELGLDGAETTYFGFPIPWNSRSPAASLGKEIYILPLVLDLLFWTWVGTRAQQFIVRFPKAVVTGVHAGVVALGVVALCLIVGTGVVNELFFSILPTPGPFSIIAVRLGFGA